MKRPTRTVRRESVVTHGRRPLVLFIPPTADVLLVREKGRHVAYEVDILSVFSLGAKKAAAQKRAERAARRKGKR